MMNQRRGERQDSSASATTPYNVFHKLPHGNSPYVRAKHVQLVDKDPEAAIVLFRKAIEEGDRVDSALKDMALLMKQQNRAGEAIEDIKFFRHRCSKQAQESLDNVLIDLYKKCGRIEEQIRLLKQKLWMIHQGEAFNGKPTKTARSHGKKFQVTVGKETSRILGNLGWAYMHVKNYTAAQQAYQKAYLLEPDANKACNLCTCLIKLGKHSEARSILCNVQESLSGSGDQRLKTRVEEMLTELEAELDPKQEAWFNFVVMGQEAGGETTVVEGLDQFEKEWKRLNRRRRLPIFEEIYPSRDQLAC